MKVKDILYNTSKPFASFELVPPLKGNDVSKLYQSIEPLMEFKPPFINVTHHRDEIQFREKPDGSYEKMTVAKRPSSVAIVAAIMKRFDVEVVPHLVCGGSSKQKLENDLLDLNFLGIENVMVLRGDAVSGQKFFIPEAGGFANSFELIEHVSHMNDGIYLDRNLTNAVKTNFCIGAAGYPEKHYESANMETDILNLKRKTDAGAAYIITQMFFDNRKFYDFIEKCRTAGIMAPIIPGLKPLSTHKHIEMLPKTFSIDIPEDLMKEVRKCRDDNAIYELGAEWCINQSRELLEYGVPAVHYYTMGKAENVKKILREVF